MKGAFVMKAFKKFYLWGMTAKFYMGLYFAAIVFFAGIITALYGGESLRLLVLLEMFGVSIFCGFTQSWIVPACLDFSHGIFFGRSVVWLLLSTAVTISVSLLGGWFQGLPTWCPWLLGVFLLLGMSFMLLGLKFDQEADTVRLNQDLTHFQKEI